MPITKTKSIVNPLIILQLIFSTQVLFLIFDFDASNEISVRELISIFMSFVVGFCKLTMAPIPSYSLIK